MPMPITTMVRPSISTTSAGSGVRARLRTHKAPGRDRPEADEQARHNGRDQGAVNVTRTRSKIMMAAGITMAVALGVTGCGEVQKLSAKDQVSDALSGFENAKSATF